MRGRIGPERRHGAVLLAMVLVVGLSAGCTSGSAGDRDTSGQSSSKLGTTAEVSATIAKGIADQLELGPQIGADYSGLRAILVMVDGRTSFEKYYKSSPDDAHDVQSVTKSVLSTLVGIAVGEAKLQLDDPLSALLPQYASAITPQTSRATLRQILTMTAGFADRYQGMHPQFEVSPDWVRDILLSADAAPGERFLYSNQGAHLVSAILEQATGESVLRYARARLFDPLGITTEPAYTSVFNPEDLVSYQRAGVAWPVDPQGHATGNSWLKLRPGDLAKIGQLYLDQGKWENRQVLPPD